MSKHVLSCCNFETILYPGCESRLIQIRDQSARYRSVPKFNHFFIGPMSTSVVVLEESPFPRESSRTNLQVCPCPCPRTLSPWQHHWCLPVIWFESVNYLLRHRVHRQTDRHVLGDDRSLSEVINQCVNIVNRSSHIPRNHHLYSTARPLLRYYSSLSVISEE